MRLALASFALAVLAVAAPARAVTTHWYYAVPGACGVSHDGTFSAGLTNITTGEVYSYAYGNTDNIVVTCQLRLPQGATITRARVWGDDPRSAGYSLQFSVKAIHYSTPGNPTTTFSGHSTNGLNTYWWNQSATDTLLIDNENNSYALNIYMTGGVSAISRLVELTYTMP